MFLYATPGERETDFDPEKFGLGYALPKYGVRPNSIGFDNAPVIIAAHQSVPSHLVKLDKPNQTWRKAGDIWIGYWNEHQPTAASLKREKQLKGRDIEAGGDIWHVPTAVSFDETDGQLFSRYHLSRYVNFDDNGELVYGDVEAEFAPLFDIAMEWIETSEKGGWLLQDLWKSAAVVLGYNYRVGYRELCMLQVLTDQTARDIMDICVDISGLTLMSEGAEKKSSVDEGSNTSDGEMVGTGSTSLQ